MYVYVSLKQVFYCCCLQILHVIDLILFLIKVFLYCSEKIGSMYWGPSTFVSNSSLLFTNCLKGDSLLEID